MKTKLYNKMSALCSKGGIIKVIAVMLTGSIVAAHGVQVWAAVIGANDYYIHYLIAESGGSGTPWAEATTKRVGASPVFSFFEDYNWKASHHSTSSTESQDHVFGNDGMTTYARSHYDGIYDWHGQTNL